MKPVSRRTWLTGCGYAAAFVGTGLLAACGGPSQPAAIVATSAPATATVAPASSAAKAAVTLAVWDWANTWKSLLVALQDQFGQLGGPKAAVEIVPDYFKKVQAAIAGGSGPDVYRTDGPNSWSLYKRGAGMALDALVARDAQAGADLKAMLPVSVQTHTYQNKLYGIPFGYTVVMTLYNRNVLQAANLTPPAELGTNWNWTTAREYGARLTNRNGDQASVYGFWVNQSWETGWLAFVYANGGRLLDSSYRKAEVDTPGTIAALQHLVDALNKDRVSPTSADLKQEDATKRFIRGNIAIGTFGSWEISTSSLIGQAKELPFDLAPIPYAPTGQSGSDSNFSAEVLNPNSKQQDAAWQWLRFIASQPAQLTIGHAEFLPARLDAAETSYFAPTLAPEHRSLLRDIAKLTLPQPSPDTVQFDDLMGKINKHVADAFSQQQTVEAALRSAQEEAAGALAAGASGG